MIKAISLAVLGGGILFLIFDLNAYDSSNSSQNEGREQQLRIVNPSIKNRKARFSQPKANQDEKEAGITKTTSTMFTQAILTIYFNKLFSQSKR